MAVSMVAHPPGPVVVSDVVVERAALGQPVQRAYMPTCVRCGRAVHWKPRLLRWWHGIEPGWRIIEP